MDVSLGAELAYLFSSVLFVVGLKRLQSPATARGGNRLAALAMLIAIVATLVDNQVLSWTGIAAGMVVGSLIGGLAARTVKMTDMPQLVGIFNGFGGGASALVAAAELVRVQSTNTALGLGDGFTIAISCLIGTVTFSGSFVAFGKLQGIVSGNPITFPLQKIFSALLFLTILVLGASIMGVFEIVALPVLTVFSIFTAIALLLGVLLVIPIGGADMPVVISLLNSYSGLAASTAGFVIGNNVLIISGALVGAAGLILTMIMCKAMNRSLGNVFFGGVGATPAASGVSDDEVYAGKIKSTSADEVAMLFDTARRVVIVPGYGMAVAQAQHAVRDLADLLEQREIEVEYAIHPVAGRMPGHMNVLLAEAEVSYEKMVEMDRINATFQQTDLALVIGANDVVNPLAREDNSGPIAGMPILDVDKSRTVVVIKRSLSPGFAGIPNPLFAADNALMFFGSAKEAVLDLVTAVKES